MICRRTLAKVLGVTMATGGLRGPVNAFSSPFEVSFYEDVTRESCQKLMKSLNAQHAARGKVMQFCECPTPPAIHMHVSSNGGSLHAGLVAYDYLNTLDNVHTHVEGLVASAATLLTVGGSHRTMTKHSMMLIHQPYIYVEGEWRVTDARDQLINMNKCVEALINIYNETSSLDVDDLRVLISNEQMLTARECLEYGFIDEIL